MRLRRIIYRCVIIGISQLPDVSVNRKKKQLLGLGGGVNPFGLTTQPPAEPLFLHSVKTIPDSMVRLHGGAL